MTRRRLSNLFTRTLFRSPPARPPASKPLRAAELLEDRTVPATFTATIDPTLNNAGAVAEIIGFVEQSNANKESDTLVLFPGGVYEFGAPYKDAKNVATQNALPVIVPNPNSSQTSITIRGEGATLKRTGAANYRLMELNFNTAFGGVEPSAIKDLTIDNGLVNNLDGGGVLITGNQSTFEFSNVIFSNNKATGTGSGGAAAFNSATAGSVDLRDCQFVSNTAGEDGGGITLTGACLVVGSTFKANNAGANGGGIFNTKGNLQVRNSLFTENTCIGGGGFSGAGGAIRIGGAAVDTIINSTFDRNFATGFGGAISFDAGAQGVLHYNTFAENASDDPAGGGAIDLDGSAISMTFSHNVFWGNTNTGKGTAGNEASDLWGSDYISQGFNFVSIGESTGQLQWTPQASDIWGTETSPLDAKLGPLQANGGPTPTRSPLQNSPLINAGSPSVVAGVTLDARGYPRQVGTKADIGALEIQVDPITGFSAPSIVITDGDRQVTAANSFFAKELQVTVLDPFGTPVPGRTVSFNGPGVIYPAGRTAVSDANGVAKIFTFATSFVGIHDVTATLLGDNLKAVFKEVNKPGEGKVIATSGDGQTAVVATQYADKLEIQAFKVSAGAFVALPNEQVYFAALPRLASGTFSNGQPVIGLMTDAQGKASVTFTANTKSGQALVVAGVGVYGATFFTLNNVADVPAKISYVSGSDQLTAVATTFAGPLTVSSEDKYGNPVGGIPVQFSGTVSSSTAGVVFPGNVTSVVTNANGIAAITVGANTKTGTHQVVATSPAVAGTVTFNLTNSLGAPGQIVLISGSNQFATVTEAFAAPLVVQVFDTAGNLMTGVGVNFGGPGGFGAGPSFTSGTTAITDSLGVARLNLAANTKAGTYAVTATIPGTTPAVFTLVNRAGPAALISVAEGDNQSAPVGTAFPIPVKIFAIDVFGNPLEGAVPSFVPPAGASATFATTPSDPAGLSTSVATANGQVGSYRVTVRLGNVVTLLSLSNTENASTPVVPLDGLAKDYAVGAGEGVTHRVWVYNENDALISEFQPYDAGFTGGVRTAVARTPDGIRIVVAPGAGRFADVRFFDTAGKLVRSHIPFENTFAGGVYLTAADINRDGWDDVVLSADQGGGPRVQVVSGRDGAVLADFFGIDDPTFRGGARVAAGDVNGDTVPDVIVAAGFGGGPRVAIYDGTTINPTLSPRRLVDDFFVFEITLRNGVFVTAGDVDGDGKADLAFGGGPSGGPRVLVLNAGDLLQGRFNTMADFFAGQPSNRGGVRVAFKDLDADNLADLVTGDGTGSGSRVTIYPGGFLTNRDSSDVVQSFDQLPGALVGVYVG